MGPVAIRHLELGMPEPPIPDTTLVWNVFWWKTLPLGTRLTTREELPFGPDALQALKAMFLAEQLAARDQALGAPLRATFDGQPATVLKLTDVIGLDHPAERIERLAAPSLSFTDQISLIICTRDRPDQLASCLLSVAAQRSAPGEIIVVDNSSSLSARAICDRFTGVVYLHEPRPGLSTARNAGIRAARLGIVAFIDDDVEPHSDWLTEIARAFETSGADAVTGLVLPVSLDAPAQQCFQFDMGGFGANAGPTLFDARFMTDTCPHGAPVWRMGAGANMAFRRSTFNRTGLFDERLGAGASGCSEDSEIWYRLLALGGTCFYEPRAVVFHHHRPDWQSLKRQMRAYMRGHVSALVAQYDAFSDRGNLNRILVQLPYYFLRTGLNCLSAEKKNRRAMLLQEILGYVSGLQFLFRRNWRRSRVEPPTA